MILDSLNNIRMYESLNSNLSKAIEFICNNDLNALPLGRNEICGELVFANIVEIDPKSKEEAKLEVHRKYIDIQIPLTADELMGYSPLETLPAPDYVEADDAALYPAGEPARNYFNVAKGEFVIFFPQDAHAPAITTVPMKKVIVKVAV
ncbi:MAG: YhcH/YjgK/YiaL family protein [Bacteroidaceae bacterium]|nr:YhcH/YjgK/YiaL family protein [Bacteroidaceae bacterium]